MFTKLIGCKSLASQNSWNISWNQTHVQTWFFEFKNGQKMFGHYFFEFKKWSNKCSDMILLNSKNGQTNVQTWIVWIQNMFSIKYSLKIQSFSKHGFWQVDNMTHPHVPHTEYVATFTPKLTSKLVNIQYMEHMGNKYPVFPSTGWSIDIPSVCSIIPSPRNQSDFHNPL